MNCTDVRGLLPLHVYGDLADGERAAVEAHLGDCAACRAELAAFDGVRRALDAPPRLTPVDVGGVFGAEAQRQRRRARRWRAAAALTAAAAVALLALRLEVRADGSQLVVRWGTPEVRPEPAAPAVVVRPEPVAPAADERLRTVSELVQALAASVEANDRERQQEIARLRQELAALNQLEKRLGQAEREVSALYTAQFGSRPSGVNP